VLTHGNAATYRMKGGCRCADCQQAHRLRCQRERADRVRRLAANPGLAPHGSASTYRNWGCRCPDCTRAHTQSMKLMRSRRERPDT
jgi:hypothetical protein